ncbi:MAG: protein kinase [Pseudomonadota bacterium]
MPISDYESSKVAMVDEENFPDHRLLRYGETTYRLGHQIARGGYSTVYKANDTWKNSLAIKEFLPKASEAMWKNEVSNYMRLRHPKIVYMHGAFILEDVPYIALEYAGLSIGRIKLGDKRERRLILMLAAKCILEALDFMHGLGFVHTDINPGNALLELSPDNRPLGVKLCDLGLSAPKEYLRPGKHMAKWNPSPETIDQKEFGNEGPAMDVYSTAQILLEVLTGEELPRFKHEEICSGALRTFALELDDPVAEALAEALNTAPVQRPSPIKLWRNIVRIPLER